MADELSQQAIAEDLYTKVEDYRGSNMCRLFDDIWNQNKVPYIIGYADAAKALATYQQDKLDDELENESPIDHGVFAAAGLVTAFYKNEIGEKVPESVLINPEQLAHEVSLIRARHVINSLDSLAGEDEGVDNEDKLTDEKISQIQQELQSKYEFD